MLCTQADMFEQYGRDALNNTFGECVVAKANEADCFANAEVQTPEERGNFNLMFTQYTFVEKKRPSFFERGVDKVIRQIARFYFK